jgi:PhzF family phenazine biosynthesis protein
MKSYRIKQVDAFTDKPFTGNFAGVVLDAGGLTDLQMQLIARENNVSETAFVLAPTQKGGDIQIRWFTPSAEVPLCGHATIASFHALAEEGMAGMRSQGQHYFRVQTRSGILAVRVEKNFKGIVVEMELPLPKFQTKRKIPSLLLESLSLGSWDVADEIPIVFDSYAYIPVKKLAKLKSLKPGFKLLEQATKSAKLLGVSVFCLETVEKASSVHSRFFAPVVSINEDPVTGSANGPLGVYLFQFVAAAGISVPSRELSDGRVEYIGEQGDELERPGRVRIRVRGKNNLAESVSIAGEAVTVMDATIKL